MTEPLTILNDCCYSALKTLPNNSVDCIITSPPYWGLRDYGIKPTAWPACSYVPMPGLPPVEVAAETSVLGLEPTLSAFVGHIVLVFEECRRVLKPSGNCWVNMGDAYASDAGGYSDTGSRGATSHKNISRKTQAAVLKGRTRKPAHGLKPKDLMGQPWRVAFALQAAGWYLRMDDIWHKLNPMPESTRDRATKAHEYFFHLTKSERYFFDTAAWAEPTSGTAHARRSYKMPDVWDTGKGGHGSFHRNGREKGKPGVTPKSAADRSRIRANDSFQAAVVDLVATRNKRSVWPVATEAYQEAHYATYPTKLIAPPLLASTSAKGCCHQCGAPWERQWETTGHVNGREKSHVPKNAATKTDSTGWAPATRSTDYWRPSCACYTAHPFNAPLVPAVVLDPFGGSGTTAQVALEHGRHAILIERGPHNIELIRKRLAPILANPVLNLA